MDRYRVVIEFDVEDLEDYEETMASIARLGVDIVEDKQVAG